jgi:hypothetical protein
MHALVHAANIQDRDGGVVVMTTLFGLYPFLLKLYADGGYQGQEFQKGVKKAIARVNVEIVKRRPRASSCCPSAGSWSAPSHGLVAVDASPRTGSASTPRRSPSSSSPPSAS